MNSIHLSELSTGVLMIIVIAAIWSIFWKGTALWHAARKGHSLWFIVLLFVNTLGVLEIIYLLGVEKVKTEKLFK